MARMRFKIEFKSVAELDAEVPDTFKTLDEATLKNIISELIRPIVKNLDPEDLRVNKNDLNILNISFPGPDKSSRFGYDRYPELSFTVNKFKLDCTNHCTEDMKNLDNYLYFLKENKE